MKQNVNISAPPWGVKTANNYPPKNPVVSIFRPSRPSDTSCRRTRQRADQRHYRPRQKAPLHKERCLKNDVSLFRFSSGGGINDFSLIHEGEDADGGVLGRFRAGVGFA